MKRNKHSLSHYHLSTFDMGQLIPAGVYEVLPGDTVQQESSVLLRVSPLVAPVMHPVVVRMHHWFVPNRLIWDGWEDFITGGPDGMDDGSSAPRSDAGPSGFAPGSIMDYMGIPPGVPQLEVSALPVRAYNLIFNEYYRDQDLMTEQSLDHTGAPWNVCWEKDYFTSARPWPQKGPEVTMPLGTSAPVVGIPGVRMEVIGESGMAQTALAVAAGNASVNVNSGAPGTNQVLNWGNQTGLVANLAGATSVDVNTVRRAFAIQRYEEARAQYGSRYTEYLRYLGVRSSDARLQRPEYLGGGKATISFSEVLQTGPGATEGSPTPGGVGQMAGHGISGSRSRRFRRFFEEHGLVVSLLSVRPRSMYANGVHKMWSRQTKEDYWQKELEQIGQQEVYSREIFAADSAAGGTNIFGWQDRYAEYKHLPSRVSSEFRNLMDYWHLARSFSSAPALNGSFVQCDPSRRIYQEQTQNHLWAMINHSIQARRMVRRSASSRII